MSTEDTVELVKLLVLGGTKFLGRAAVEVALARGHEVTLFNRGQTNPELFPDLERLQGDRNGDLSALAGRAWDAVIDTSGYVPHAVRVSAELLRDSVGHYLFVSSQSVYADQSGPVVENESPLADLGDMPADRLLEDYSNYGALKVLCEDAVREAFGPRTAIVRPGLIVGAHDPTGRFTYWPHRIARGGDVVVPAPPERTVQFIDVRDLAEWMVDLCERAQDGTFNATHLGVSWGEVVETCRQVSCSDAQFVWVSDEFLREHDVGEWMELPLWIHDPDLLGIHLADVSLAQSAGLTFRPLAKTVRATLDEAERTDDAGLKAQREGELLAAWHAR
jgi:2'-hydroxyisoflavone reductase